MSKKYKCILGMNEVMFNQCNMTIDIKDKTFNCDKTARENTSYINYECIATDDRLSNCIKTSKKKATYYCSKDLIEHKNEWDEEGFVQE
jgi:hypothetical protein